MRRFALAASAVFALGIGSASAADLRPAPVRPAPVVAPVYDWNGFYIGVMGGGGWSNADWNFGLFPGVNPGRNGSGGFVGGTIGYNWAWPNSSFVLGFEADGGWADISANDTCLLGGTFGCRSKIDALASIRGRLGYAAGPVLIYGTGGAGYASINFRARETATGLLLGEFNDNAWGWTAGGGIEFGFWGNWSAKVEYLHYGFGRERTGVFGGTTEVNASIDTVKAGINYRFNWNTPGVGRY